VFRVGIQVAILDKNKLHFHGREVHQTSNRFGLGEKLCEKLIDGVLKGR
jgi:hypothetical protein